MIRNRYKFTKYLHCMQEFHLLEDEKIIEEIKPVLNLKKFFFLKLLAVVAPLIFFVDIFLYTVLIVVFNDIIVGIIFALAFFILLTFGIAMAFSGASYNKFYYWITNKRVIAKRGIIGYQIVSIPFERISDIIISRTFLENIVGIASLHVQTLAGQSSFMIGRGFGNYSLLGSEGQLFGIPNPEETQNKILQLARMKRKDEGLTM